MELVNIYTDEAKTGGYLVPPDFAQRLIDTGEAYIKNSDMFIQHPQILSDTLTR